MEETYASLSHLCEEPVVLARRREVGYLPLGTNLERAPECPTPASGVFAT